MSGIQPRPALARPQSSGKPRHAVTQGAYDAEITALATEGLTGDEIGRRVGCGHMTAKARLAVLGVTFGRRRNPSNAPVAAGLRDNDILEWLAADMRRREIATRLGCNMTVLCYRILALKADGRG